MGTDIDQDEFDEGDYSRFAEQFEECLSALGQLLERPGFGAGPATVGAELELFLVDRAARPLPLNQAIRAAAAPESSSMMVRHSRCRNRACSSPRSATSWRASSCPARSRTGTRFSST